MNGTSTRQKVGLVLACLINLDQHPQRLQPHA